MIDWLVSLPQGHQIELKAALSLPGACVLLIDINSLLKSIEGLRVLFGRKQ
jgi:hypothetical protein